MTTNNILSKVLVFAAGALVGSAVTYKIVKTKYERIVQEEIDSVIESFTADAQRTPDESEESKDEESIQEYEDIIKSNNYVSESNDDEIQNEGVKDMDRPYVISPEEFSENGYETISLTYYANGVLVDEFGGVIDKEDWEEMIGEDFASHFGEYEEDSVFVRNDPFGIDYEILKDLGDYPEE